jgi:hypothetical protein
VAGERVLPSTPASDELRANYDITLRELANDLRAGRLEDAARVAAKALPVSEDARRKERNKKKRDRKAR